MRLSLLAKPCALPPEIINSKGRYLFWIGLAAILLMAIPILDGLFALWWSDETFNGLSLVPLMAISLLYRKRNEFNKKAISRFMPLYCASAGVAVLMLWVFFAGSVRLAGYLFVISLILLFFGSLGKKMGRACLGPLVFMSLMVPPYNGLANEVTLMLQHIFSFTVDLLAPLLSSDYIGREGFILLFMNYDRPIIIAPECSGIRSLLGMLIIGLYLVIMDHLPLGKTTVMILTSIAVALTFNLIRIIATIELRLCGLKTFAEGRWHGLFGAGICLLGFVILDKLSKWLRDHRERK